MQLSGLLIIGGGGHGKVVADAAMSSGWSRVAFLDDRGQALGSPAGLPILGAVSELQAHAGKFSAAVVALGDGRRRLLLQAECLAAGLEVVSIIHPTAFVSRFASLAPGCVICRGTREMAGRGRPFHHLPAARTDTQWPEWSLLVRTVQWTREAGRVTALRRSVVVR